MCTAAAATSATLPPSPPPPCLVTSGNGRHAKTRQTLPRAPSDMYLRLRRCRTHEIFFPIYLDSIHTTNEVDVSYDESTLNKYVRLLTFYNDMNACLYF